MFIDFQEEILLHLHSVLNRARNQFPRLFFLSNQEVVELLGISRNPRALQPFARKCFQGVIKLVYDLPVGTTSMNSALDYALNGKSHKPLYVHVHVAVRVGLTSHLVMLLCMYGSSRQYCWL